MNYIGNIIRPPSEGQSLLVQTTVGCSHNRCTFCGAYKGVPFRQKEKAVIMKDLDEAARLRIPFDKIFFPDGDALIMPTADLLEIITTARRLIPSICRAAVYANTKAILRKSPGELFELRTAGLGIVYQGIESGNEAVLRRIQKGALPRHMIESAEKIKEAGIKLSQTVLLGIGGTALSRDHAVDTGKLLARMSPDYASALTVMALPNTPLYAEIASGAFVLPRKFELLGELKTILENLDISSPCYFTSNHASNYLPIKVKLPEERENALELLDRTLNLGNDSILRPEYLRGL